MGQQELERGSEVSISEPQPSFIGVDLAWHGDGRHTGLAVSIAAQAAGSTTSTEAKMFCVEHQP
jgi:hypothetical protein